jgi:hypothetical protein
VPYRIAVPKLRRALLYDFFIPVRLLKRRERLTEPDFALLARAFNRARTLLSAEEQKKRCGLIVDRVRIPSDLRARI